MKARYKSIVQTRKDVKQKLIEELSVKKQTERNPKTERYSSFGINDYPMSHKSTIFDKLVLDKVDNGDEEEEAVKMIEMSPADRKMHGQSPN